MNKVNCSNLLIKGVFDRVDFREDEKKKKERK